MNQDHANIAVRRGKQTLTDILTLVLYTSKLNLEATIGS